MWNLKENDDMCLVCKIGTHGDTTGGDAVKRSLVFAAAVGLMPMSTTANAFSTTECQACHAIDYPMAGPSFKAIIAKYGNEQALAKAFEGGFAVKDRKVASADANWARKAAQMTGQYRMQIKGHGKEAAHAVFATVKDNIFGNY